MLSSFILTSHIEDDVGARAMTGGVWFLKKSMAIVRVGISKKKEKCIHWALQIWCRQHLNISSSFMPLAPVVLFCFSKRSSTNTNPAWYHKLTLLETLWHQFTILTSRRVHWLFGKQALWSPSRVMRWAVAALCVQYYFNLHSAC